jgi:hypothetical protein
MKSILFLTLCIIHLNVCAMDEDSLANDKIVVHFNSNGINAVYDKAIKKTVFFENENTQIVIDNTEFNSKSVAPQNIKKNKLAVSWFYAVSGFNIEIKYELSPGWRFVAKQVFITSLNKEEFVVNKIEPAEIHITNVIKEQLQLNNGRYGVSLRLKNFTKGEKGYGCFMTVQNPFTKYSVSNNSATVVYDPEMKWYKKDGFFSSDKLCIGLYDLSGVTYRASMLPEWNYVQQPDNFLEKGQQIDQGEVTALTECLHAFLLINPKKSVRVHIGWCENDYQIDVSTRQGNEEYKRIIDQASALGCQYVLYTPGDNAVAPLEENKDAWGWENSLWFNMGQKIRKDKWKPGDALPSTVKNIADYAKNKNVELLAYVYPSMPFLQDSTWTAWRTSNNKKPEGYTTVDTGIRSFQDWLIDKLISFAKETGCAGFSFDHWWIAYTNDPEDKNVKVSSPYQQWSGCRRVLEVLRERAPNLIIDGRQQYQQFGTWTWLAGNYPHPTMSDEQPGSFVAFPDLSTDRISAARQRSMAYKLMIDDFIPVEIMPGFITHQTQRLDGNNVLQRDHFRVKDWDYLGWQFSLLSSISTAPFNHVVNYIPARDSMEYATFSKADKAFFNYWLDFTDKNVDYLKNIKPILGQPMVGKCDGTSAIIKDNGYIFIFNPNYRPLTSTISLDASIGLTGGEKFILKEIYPANGIVEKGILLYGEKVQLDMPGISARIFKIEPVNNNIKPILINSTGDVSIDSKILRLKNISGVIGAKKIISVLLPGKQLVTALFVNGKKVAFSQSGERVNCTVQFKGSYFPKAYSLVKYNSSFKGNSVTAEMTIPKRIFEQLNQRKIAWPISYSDDDKLAPWLAPSRLLLYIQIADPYKDVKVQADNKRDSIVRKEPMRKSAYSLTIDGKSVELQEAYNGVYPSVERTYLGVYADISLLKPGVPYKVVVKLPVGLQAGQFQGLFIDHVEDEFTTGLK